jgi:hypothetical protein
VTYSIHCCGSLLPFGYRYLERYLRICHPGGRLLPLCCELSTLRNLSRDEVGQALRFVQITAVSIPQMLCKSLRSYFEVSTAAVCRCCRVVRLEMRVGSQSRKSAANNFSIRSLSERLVGVHVPLQDDVKVRKCECRVNRKKGKS